MGGFIAKQAFIPPPRGRYTHADAPITVETSQGEKIVAFEAVYPNSSKTILMSHGNADDLGGHARDWAYFLSKTLKINVVCYDYVGYGLSECGAPTESSAIRSINAIYEYILTKREPSQVILWGISLGTGPTVDLAARTPNLGGTILQSPLMSAVRVIFPNSPTLPIDIFVNIAKIKRIECPLFIIHGTDDEVIPFVHGERLHAAAGVEKTFPPLWITGGHHNDLESSFCDVMLAGISEFLSTL